MSGGSTNGPVASTFTFLADLPSLPQGTKVRCLGLILEYDTRGGRLLLEHTYPKPGKASRIWLDISLVLEHTDHGILQTGNWVNVIGYTQDILPIATTQSKENAIERNISTVAAVARVQAILLWDAGSVHIEEYEKIVEDQKRVQREMRAIRKARSS